MAIITDIAVPAGTGLAIKAVLIAQHAMLPPNKEPNTLRVFVVREPFDDIYTVVLDNGHTEEYEEDDLRAWLMEHGANEDLTSQTITQAWNFKCAIAVIKNPVVKQQVYRPEAPRLSLL